MSGLVIAPYWDDIDMSEQGRITYVAADGYNVSLVQEVSDFVASVVAGFKASWALVARWEDVCSYRDDDCIEKGDNVSAGHIRTHTVRHTCF